MIFNVFFASVIDPC